jgi:hypothetical protein
MRPVIFFGVLAVGALTACSSGPRDAMDVATSQLEHRVDAVSQALPLDTTGAFHQAAGRDAGLLSASVVYDKRVQCAPGGEPSSCGAVLEEWPSALAAKKRAEALKGQGVNAFSVGEMVVQLSDALDATAQQQYTQALQGN